MCIDFYGHHSGGSSFVYVQMIFVITEIVCALIGTGTALRKNRSMRVPVQYSIVYRYSIDSIAPWTSVRIRQSGRAGIGGVTKIVSNMNVTKIPRHP